MAPTKKDQTADQPTEQKPSKDEQLITILEKLASHTVGVDVDIANFKADVLGTADQTTDQTA